MPRQLNRRAPTHSPPLSPPGRRTPFRRLLVIGLCAISTLAAPAWAREVTMEVSVNREQIYLGESLQLILKVDGATTVKEPDVSAIRDAVVRPREDYVQRYSSTTINQGRRQNTVFEGRIFIYEVTPNRQGAFTVGPITLDTGTQRITESGKLIQVQGVEKQDNVIITIASHRDSVLVDEPFEIDLTLLLRRLPEAYAQHDPLDPRTPPRIEAPFLEPAPIDGLESPDIRGLLQQALVQDTAQAGFAVNRYTITSDFFSFGPLAGERPAAFRFPREPKTIDGIDYFAYSVKLRYTPVKEGSYTFGPVLFKGNIVTAVDRGGYIRTASVFAVGPALTVNVVPPPEDGRPPSFIGAIGADLKVTTTLDTQACKVGDPLTLTLDVSGPVRFENVFPPRLSLQPALTNDFRLYEDTLRTEAYDGGRRYSYTIRPMRVGTYEVPPIAIAYFDSATRAYHEVHSDPIPLRAAGAVDVDVGAIVAFATNPVAAIRLTISQAESVPAPVTLSSAGGHRTDLIARRPLAVAAGIGPAGFALACILRVLGALGQRRRATQRQRQALRQARRALRTASAQADTRRARQEMRRAMGQYLCDRCAHPGVSITPGEAARVMTELAVPAGLRDRFMAIYETAFNEEFAGSQSPDTAGPNTWDRDEIDQASSTLDGIERWANDASRRQAAAGEDLDE